jgi:hypothetical protein
MLQHTFFFFLVSLLLLLFLFASLLSLLLVTRLFCITETSQTAQSNKYSLFQFLGFSLSFFRLSSLLTSFSKISGSYQRQAETDGFILHFFLSDGRA